MQISWHGGSTIELSVKKQKAILNPSKKTELKDYSVVVYDTTDEKRVTPEGVLMVDWPGEYDRAGFSFRGIEQADKKNSHISYAFHTRDGVIAWLGEMKEYPSEDFIEELGEVHVLIVPVGGDDVLSGKDAFRLVEALEPLVVIPVCYAGAGLSPVGDDRKGLSEFLKELDVKMPTAVKSYDLKKSALDPEKMELIVLDPSA